MEVDAIRHMDVKQKDLVQKREAFLAKIDSLEILPKFVALQWCVSRREGERERERSYKVNMGLPSFVLL